MKKPTKSKKSKTTKSTAKHRQSQPKPKAKPVAVTTSADGGNPYRAGTMYATLFEMGSRDYIQRDELIRRVAKACNKEERLIAMGFSVLKQKSHASNNGRSSLLQENGLVKLITLKHSSTA